MPHHAQRHAAALDRIRTEPPTIDADMRPADIADTLRRLRFGPGHAQTVRVADAEVRTCAARPLSIASASWQS